MKNPLVTVSIPVYNCEKFIIDCLQSVAEQTYPYIEVILVNDCTKDGSAEIARDFIAVNGLSLWNIVNLPENSGLSVVRNKGIEAAKGKYIFFLDSDDELFPDSIESLVNLAEETNADITMGEVTGIRLPGKEELDVFPIYEKRDVLEGNSGIFESFINGGFAVSSWNKLIKLDFLKNHHLLFTKGLFAQDSLHSFEMALLAEKIAFLRKKTYKYYLHAGSVIHNRKKIHFDNWITIAQKINEYYEREKNEAKKRLILRYLIDFKSMTLQMNWKAQKNEELWKRSYKAYSKLKGLSFPDYFSSKYSMDLKKKNLFISLPVDLGFRFFKWRYER